ncbi:WRN-like protein [Mya arenaria]|uniref:DNA 3'-5' helicase n=1 Tax=Mya arenaria TaxID=6604 RepID=A0ABY7FSZ0_MYAAR|nr:WRN-like protein [Mya arenaria]
MDVSKLFGEVKKKYGLQFDLKEHQIDTITALLDKNDVSCVLPTGYGKSLCYVLPPLLLDEAHLDKFGIKSMMASHEHQINLSEIGNTSLIFTTPETLQTSAFRKILAAKDFQKRLCLLACDEAHCVSEWGESFRPEYRHISSVRSIVDVPFLAATATATQRVQDDIKEHLLLADDLVTVAVVPDRPSIFLTVEKCSADNEKELQWLLDLLKETDFKTKTVVFCRSYNAVSLVWSHIVDSFNIHPSNSQLLKVEMFHASTDSIKKEMIIDSFKSPESYVRVLVSTVAFGMGMSVPDINLVVHWGAPHNALSYWQEVGRAGRLGQNAIAVMMAFPRSLMKTLTSEDVRECVKGDVCIRKTILTRLLVDGMEQKDIPTTTPCVSLSCEKCFCEACLCCSVCLEACTCVGKMSSLEKLRLL